MPGRRPIEPAKPEGMELIFFYACPYCGRKILALATGRPFRWRVVIRAPKTFQFCLWMNAQYVFAKLMLANGKAAIDPDFM